MNYEFLGEKTKRKNNQSGAAMLIAVVFFLFISLAIISGLVSPTVREFRNASANLSSKQSYFLAESGTEDALYRVLKSITISSNETLTLNNSSATTTITSLSGSSEQISSLGNVGSLQRKTNITLSTNPGVSFNYGVQVGQGGLYLDSGAISGNVYSNGSITASTSGSNSITGTAISANSPALVADQTNGSGTPANNVLFANASGTQDVAQSFQLVTSSPLNQIQVYLKKVGTPSNITVRIVNDASGSPGNTVLATGTISASTITTSYGWITSAFTTNPLLNTATPYWLVLDAGTSSTNYYIIGASSGGYANGTGKIGQFGGTWNNTSPSGLDYYFSVYLGGVTGLISGAGQYTPLSIGGGAQAHTVNSVSAGGSIYCVSAQYNNKTCLTQADPTYVAFPVSGANITQWETTATAGGTINGDENVGSWPTQYVTLGPQKIIGNLNVYGGGVLTVSGALYVTGNVTLNGGATIQLASGYGANDGVIVADGTITINGGGHATGSGTSGSYLMLLSNNSSSNAVSVSGGAGAVIVYAPSGTINVSGGASLNEATGYQVSVTGGSSVTYQSGLVNNNFSSGPSGSWAVQTWGESQ